MLHAYKQFLSRHIAGASPATYGFHFISKQPHLTFSTTTPIALLNAAFNTKLPSKVRIVEVGPRDGLQSEPIMISTSDKLQLIQQLIDAGLQSIEVASFVNPKRVPQMGDGDQVLANVPAGAIPSYQVLAPNIQGFERAKQAGAKEVSVLTAASESFQQKNANSSIEESLKRMDPILKESKKHHIAVRGYISCALGCPYEGEVDFHKVVELTKFLLQRGCYEVSICDTIGVATAGSTATLLQLLQSSEIPFDQLAVHFHDTYGQALANIFTALQFGINVLDTSIGGLGGCPFAKGATGNVATEDVIYMLHGLGIDHGLDMKKLLSAASFILDKLGKSKSRVGTAISAKEKS